MPAETEKQRKFMGSELSRKRSGKKTQTKMTEKQLAEFSAKKKAHKAEEGAVVALKTGGQVSAHTLIKEGWAEE